MTRPGSEAASLLGLLLTAGSLGLAGGCSSEGAADPVRGGATGGVASSTGGMPAATGGAPDGMGGGTGGTDMDPDEDTPPQWLSETGLYAADGATLAEGVEPFEPRFPLWTDAAAKARWIALPPGTQIDTTDPDRWVFPPGTRLWKEFTRDDVRVETRLLELRPDGTWWMIAYQWNDDQTDAEARPLGLENASGTDHDIPSEEDCRGCHVQSSARVLGFGALQLAHDGEGLTLADLIDGDLLSDPPEAVPELPGTEQEQRLLGYLHANCGHCHQPTASASARSALRLWLPLGVLAEAISTDDTPFYQTTVGVNVSQSDISPEGKTVHITPGEPLESALFLRVSEPNRGTSYQMPPLGTEDADDDFVADLASWISGL